MKLTMKSWATPIAAGAFLISGVTGVLIFFHIETGLVEPVHKWLSWLLVGGVSVHLLANWKAFSLYFSKNSALAVFAAAMLVTALSVMPFFGDEEHEKTEKRTARSLVRALESSSLTTVALVVNDTPETLDMRLKRRGIKDTDPSMTVSAIADASGMEAGDVLAILVGGKNGHEKGND
ncbi:MAG: hypothetical protein A3K90_05825 [Pelodictyon luteolum]|uniref:Flavinylation-associated cytochrome domain-containing protein n=2 Tax=Pelodictyon luteolum TaxID=1100 RepID=Q3B3K8_CHLL3|nr:DUF4405 domain-containing protein [Pelodictyon luteolum]ABB24073.1 hypothetical protein Plut_1211 [Pelodictyon luteolum DSM 273]KZK75290.1 MAG: hypothetical protein A3K90_05825 [Pelodictyon luteolum]